MALLSIRNLDLSIHGAPILKSVSFDIAAGEIVAVTGESGSGKSMTALSVMQLLPEGAEASGKVLVEDKDVLRLPEAALCRMRGNDVGMVFQEPMTALNPLMSIGDQVAEAIRLHQGLGRVEALERAKQVLARVELPEARFPAARYPHELSGGQRQRVVIALAIACRPKLLIADEPTTALDVTTQAQILKLLQRLVAEDGMGMLIITHDLAVVASLADRIVVMRHGEVVEAAPTAQLLAKMEHPYTRMLFAASAHRPELSPLPPSPPVLLEVEGVIRDYPVKRKSLFAAAGRMRAVDGVSFTIAKGERVGLVGESGCGKSTLTRAILGLEPVQGGTIRIAGDIVDGAAQSRASRRRMQAVFQDPYGSFNPRHRVERLICEPFHLLEAPPVGADRAAAVAEALTAVGLKPEDAEKYIHEFSGGQRQRIAIARALIIRPELIVLDEAVSALDVSVRAQVLDLLADLSARYGLAMLFISHDLEVVRGMTDRVMVMQAGKIVEEGPTSQVLSAPRHAYTQRLLDAAPKLPQVMGLPEV